MTSTTVDSQKKLTPELIRALQSNGYVIFGIPERFTLVTDSASTSLKSIIKLIEKLTDSGFNFLSLEKLQDGRLAVSFGEYIQKREEGGCCGGGGCGGSCGGSC